MPQQEDTPLCCNLVPTKIGSKVKCDGTFQAHNQYDHFEQVGETWRNSSIETLDQNNLSVEVDIRFCFESHRVPRRVSKISSLLKSWCWKLDSTVVAFFGSSLWTHEIPRRALRFQRFTRQRDPVRPKKSWWTGRIQADPGRLWQVEAWKYHRYLEIICFYLVPWNV